MRGRSSGPSGRWPDRMANRVFILIFVPMMNYEFQRAGRKQRPGGEPLRSTVMVKKVKGNADSQLSQSVRESAHLIWLAGLGAFAKVSGEGGKLFDALVEEGEKVEAREKADETRGKVADTWDKVEQIFEDRLARVLGRLGVPGRDDLRELTQRVDALQEYINGLRETRENQQSQ